MPTNALPLYGLLVAVMACTAAAPWLRRLYRRRFVGAETDTTTPPPLAAEWPDDMDAGPFVTTRQVCFAGVALVAVALLGRIPVLDGPSWAPTGPLRLLALGLMPFVSANSLVVMVAILLPWLRRRTTSLRGLDRATVVVYASTAALALYQALAFTGHFGYFRPNLVPTTVSSFLPAWVWLFAGAMLCLGLALAINRVCGGHGFSLVFTVQLAAVCGHSLTGALGALRSEADAPGIRLGAFLLPIVPLALFSLVTAGLLAERTLTLVRRDGQGTVRLPVPIAMTGEMPLFLAANCIHPLLNLLGGRELVLNKHLVYGSAGFMALQGAFVVLFMYVYALLLLLPGGLRERLTEGGLMPVAVRGGRTAVAMSVGRLLWTLQWPWLGVLLLSAWTPQVLGGGLGVPLALASGFVPVVVPLAALTAAFLTQQSVRRRDWVPVFRHRELYEILTVRALLAERGIPAEITWQEAYGALTGMFIGPLAGKCLHVPGDRWIEAAGIVEEYQCSLTPGRGEPHASDEVQ